MTEDDRVWLISSMLAPTYYHDREVSDADPAPGQAGA